jgi:hypothetical protein
MPQPHPFLLMRLPELQLITAMLSINTKKINNHFILIEPPASKLELFSPKIIF